MLRHCVLACLFLLSTTLLYAQDHSGIVNHVHGEMSFLAGDALRGRGSATHDEFVAASYVASQFQSFGLEAEVQRVPLEAKVAKDAAKNAANNEASNAAPKAASNAKASAATATAANAPASAFTYNAIGLLRGSDPALAAETILLSSHLDHLGARSTPTGEVIYHGADDDASGTTAVLELARAFGSLGNRPRRSILFVCFGSEETGGQGDQYFLAHPPLPLASIVVNLEFEMIGRPDPAVRSDQFWLTGWERSDLGPALARHGAPLAADPHPAQHFFRRSDNFALARQGIVAQTVSSYGLGAHYHQPGDDLANIDFQHLAHAIEWMIAPIQWLADTAWKPSWNPGGRP
jgi:Zn-dependent M28 family amino/carboxypeptidase